MISTIMAPIRKVYSRCTGVTIYPAEGLNINPSNVLPYTLDTMKMGFTISESELLEKIKESKSSNWVAKCKYQGQYDGVNRYTFWMEKRDPAEWHFAGELQRVRQLKEQP